MEPTNASKKKKQIAAKRVNSSIASNSYDKYDYRSMVNACTHLNKKEKRYCLSLFKQYSHAFDGGISTVPGPPVHLKLKPGAVPYYVHPYMIVCI